MIHSNNLLLLNKFSKIKNLIIIYSLLFYLFFVFWIIIMSESENNSSPNCELLGPLGFILKNYK